MKGRQPIRVRFTRNYRTTVGNWNGPSGYNHFAVRWTGRLRSFRASHCRFSITPDDSSKLWIVIRYTITNNGLLGWRSREAIRHLGSGWHLVKLEMFEKGGRAGSILPCSFLLLLQDIQGEFGLGRDNVTSPAAVMSTLKMTDRLAHVVFLLLISEFSHSWVPRCLCYGFRLCLWETSESTTHARAVLCM